MSDTKVSAHDFEPLSFWDRWRKKGRCRACYYSKQNHPVGDWTLARHLGDKSPADRKRIVRASEVGWL
jgi:hypothetical protein